MAQRLGVNISDEDAKRLNDLASYYNSSITDVVRRAIFTESYLKDLREQGWRIVAEDADGKKARELVFMGPALAR
jgi:hypothetical protein